MKNDQLHSLKIEGGKIKLDDFTLKGVTGYELKSPAAGTTELVLKIVINSNAFID